MNTAVPGPKARMYVCMYIYMSCVQHARCTIPPPDMIPMKNVVGLS